MKTRLLPLLLAGSIVLPAQDKITYEDHIFPIFEQSCLNCHNPDKKKGDLDLSSYPALLVGGSGGKVALAGDGGSSKLYTVTTGSEEPVMPPEGSKIDKETQNLIRAWIDGGMLETKDSTARKQEKPKFDLAISPSAGKPEGPPPMPDTLSLDPAFVAPREGLIRGMTTSPWAPLLAFTGQKQILLYHSETFRFLGSLPFPKGQPATLSFHPSGKYLIASGGVAGKSGQATVWDITTGKQLFTAGREFDTVLATALSPDLATMAMGGPSRLLKIWDTREGKQTASIKKHTEWITALAASPDGKYIASGDRNGAVHVWDWAGNEIHVLRDHQGGVTSLAFRSDSKLLASTAEDGQLIIWNLAKGEAAKKINAHKGGITSLHYHRDGHLVTAGRDRVVKVFKPDFAEKLSVKNPELVTAVALSPNGKHLFAGDYAGEVFVYDLASSKSPLTTLESNPPALADRLGYLKKSLTDSRAKVEAATNKLAEVKEKENNLRSRINGTRQALQKNEGLVKSLQEQQNQLKKQLDENEARIKTLQKPRETSVAALKQAHDKLSKLSAERKKQEQAKADLAAIIREIKAHKESLATLTASAKQQNEQWNQLHAARKGLAEERKQIPQRVKELTELIATGKESVKELESKLPDLSRAAKEPQKALAAAQEELTALEEDFAFWQSQLTSGRESAAK